MDIEVMYADKINGKFRTSRVLVSQMNTLDKSNVLFIILSDVDPVTQQRKRISEVWEHTNIPTRWHVSGGDYYAVIQKPGFIMLTGWNEQQWIWMPTNGNLWDGARRNTHTKPPDFGDNSQVTIFKGKFISNEEWELAKNQFQAEMK